MKRLTVSALASSLLVAALPALGQTRPRITSVSHLGVYATDMDKTQTFYAHDLGAFKASDPENPQGVRYYFSPTQFVEVLPLPAGYTSINRLDHVAFNTDNAEAMRKYLGANGVQVPSAVQKGSDGSEWIEVKDPEGNNVQFVQAPRNPPNVPLDTLSSHIIHVGYMVHSREAEDTFYRKLLGFRPYWYGGPRPNSVVWISQQVPDGRDWLEYMMVTGSATGIPANVTANSLGSMDHFALGVHDIKQTALLLYQGDRIPPGTSGPKIGADGKWQYNLFSPDGTRAEIMEFQPVGKPCCSDFTAPSPTE
jgi:catechol 2,3-dioxygenase-like lactoylglutathione lyase family enzyme